MLVFQNQLQSWSSRPCVPLPRPLIWFGRYPAGGSGLASCGSPSQGLNGVTRWSLVLCGSTKDAGEILGGVQQWRWGQRLKSTKRETNYQTDEDSWRIPT